MLLYSRVCARPSSLYLVEPSRKDDQESSRVRSEYQASSAPLDQCQSTEESNDILVNSGLLPSDGLSVTKVNSSSEAISLKNNHEDIQERFDKEDLRGNFPFPMDAEICARSFAPADSVESAKHSQGGEETTSLTIMDASETDIMEVEHPSSSNFEVEDASGGSARIASEHSIDNGCMPAQNHVNEKEGILVDDFVAVSSSNLDSVESKSASSGEKILQYAARRSERRRSCKNPKPLFTPGFLDRRLQNKSSRGGEVSVEVGKISGGNIGCCTNGINSESIEKYPMKRLG